MHNQAIRKSPINIRALQAQRDLIDKAASILHKNRSDFMLDVACREAEKVLLDQRLFYLNESDFIDFEEALDKPLADTEKLKSLMSDPSPWD